MITLLNLSEEAFRLLGGVRDKGRQYRAIYEKLNTRCSHFAVLSISMRQEAPREALDHYLPRCRYPFAGANAKNLVPMGNRCNSAYKRTADVLWDGATR